MINTRDILETIEMIQDENLDIRTVTMGISLLDCADKDINVACEKIYNKITTLAKNLVPVCQEIEKEYGIPIVNKRISVTPISIVGNSCKAEDFTPFAETLDKAAKTVGVNFIGGFSALVHKGYTSGDRRLINSIPEALAKTDFVCSSVNVATTKTGINLDAVAEMGKIVKKSAELTADNNCIGAAKLVVFANAVEDNPFMAGAFLGVGEPECVINVGVSGPGVVRAALKKAPNANITEVCDIIKKTAFKITRMGQLVANEASKRLGVPFGIVDLSLAPTPAVGDSVADILEEIGLAELANDYPSNLSGGEMRRVSIVRAMLNEPKIILADEPTSNLDPENSHKVMQMLRDISNAGTTVLLSTHELEYLDYVDSVIKMEKGKMI